MPRSTFLVAYDVATVDLDGARRLRHVAKACAAYGQRVQNSVWECPLTEAQFEELLARLLEIIDPDEDNLRIYRLPSPLGAFGQSYGQGPAYDLRGTLVV